MEFTIKVNGLKVRCWLMPDDRIEIDAKEYADVFGYTEAEAEDKLHDEAIKWMEVEGIYADGEAMAEAQGLI